MGGGGSAKTAPRTVNAAPEHDVSLLLLQQLHIALDEEEKPRAEVVPLTPKFDPRSSDYSSTRWLLSELIWLDANPVYTFNFKTIFSYLMLFNIESHFITVVRRFIFFLVLVAFLFLGLAQLQIFYETISFRSVLWVFRIAYENVLALHLKSKEDFTTGMLLYTLAVPAVITGILFVLLFPIFSQSRSIAETLHWGECETRLGRYMIQNCRLPEKRHESFESKLVDNMSVRVGFLARSQLYQYFGETFMIPMPAALIVDDEVDFMSTRLVKRALKVIWYLLRTPIFLMALPVHVFPAFTMWYALLIAPARVLPSSTPCGAIYRMCRMPVLILGLILLNIISFYLCIVYGQVCLLFFTISPFSPWKFAFALEGCSYFHFWGGQNSSRLHQLPQRPWRIRVNLLSKIPPNPTPGVDTQETATR